MGKELIKMQYNANNELSINLAEYEYDLISCVINAKKKNKTYDVISKLDPKMFYSRIAREIWSSIKLLYSESKFIDLVSISENLNNNNANMANVVDIIQRYSCESNLFGYAKRVRSSFYVRDAQHKMREALKVIDTLQSVDQVSKVAESVTAVLSGLILETDDKLPRLFKDIAKDYIDVMQKKAQGDDDELTLTFGITALDEALGGVNTTDLIMLAGVPGSGKTEQAVNILTSVAMQGKPVLAFSMEMSDNQIVERTIANLSNLSTRTLRNPKYMSEMEWSIMGKGLAEVVNTNYYVLDQARLTVEDICAKALRHQQEHPNLALIMIDYIGLIDIPDSYNLSIALGDVSKRLKQLAKEIRVPILLLGQVVQKQVNARPIHDRRPMASDLKDASKIEDNCDTILMVYRPQVYEKTAPAVAEIILAKARHAEQGQRVYFGWQNGHFRDIEQGQAFNLMEDYEKKPEKTKRNF